ncbi:MAG TPA: hypothetical protein PLI67_11365 [Niabella sp.]|nr:hypothetical protein [Niabella sp.]
MDHIDFGEIIKVILTVLGSFVVYYLKKLVEEVGVIKDWMQGTAVQVGSHEKRLDRLEERVNEFYGKG